MCYIKHLPLSHSLMNVTAYSGRLVVDPLNPEREVGVRYLPPPCCVLEQRHIYSTKNTSNTKEVV